MIRFDGAIVVKTFDLEILSFSDVACVCGAKKKQAEPFLFTPNFARAALVVFP